MKYSVLLLILLLAGRSTSWWFWGGEAEDEADSKETEERTTNDESNDAAIPAESKPIDNHPNKDEDSDVDSSRIQTSGESEKTIERKLNDAEESLAEPTQTDEVIHHVEQGDDVGEVEPPPVLPGEEKPIHFHEDGEHNLEYDHKAFLGDEAEAFKHLTPEESKERLASILVQVDTDTDGLVSVQELTAWIKLTGERSVQRRTEIFWERSNPELRPELSWDEYRARQYGFLTDLRDRNAEGRWVGEDDVDSDTLNVYRKLEERDRRRWTVADRNKNTLLNKDEFLAFLHPEAVPYMTDVLVTETMADLDKDGDGKLNLKEYVLNVFGDTQKVEEWDTAGIQFRQFRDFNKDGFIDKKELQAWLLPTDYDQNKAEAEHLVYESDQNGDKLLSKAEAMDRYSIFVASQATNFGEDLHHHHDEL